MFKRVISSIVILLFAVPAFAGSSPVDMLKKTSDQLLQSLKQNKNKIKENPNYVYQLTDEILLPHVDITAMSRLALGRQHWMAANAAQRKQFMQEFSNLMVRTYATALSAYTDEEIKFRPLRIDPNKEKRVQVDSVIIQRGGPSIPVSYRLFKRGDDWKVYDMTVDGVSMVQSFHSQFANEVSKNGMDGLLKAMSKHAKQAG